MSFLFKKVAAQDSSNEEIFMKSHIRLFNEAKEKGDAKLLDFVKRSWNAAKVKPNYKAMSNNPAYRELDKMAQDSAAMDDLNDGIKTIENKARALIADAKNARSKYADILARSEIAKNNAQVKKTFEDDIARCDKLINALKAI
jgi:poly-D-alanine transfer protein DltD